ncbi:hypothetical protein [Pelotomaculum propionicicum]|nr:hypothetical protein [Pelotomaculum propionicicum]
MRPGTTVLFLTMAGMAKDKLPCFEGDATGWRRTNDNQRVM